MSKSKIIQILYTHFALKLVEMELSNILNSNKSWFHCNSDTDEVQLMSVRMKQNLIFENAKIEIETVESSDDSIFTVSEDLCEMELN